MKDEVIMDIIGEEVDIFCEIDPSLAEFLVMKRVQKILHVQLDKALYGCVQLALLWYELYSSNLKYMGFDLNPYNMCVANANIDVKHCTVCWYLGDNKIIHVNPKVVDKVIETIEGNFGKMPQTRGDKHNFLGMSI